MECGWGVSIVLSLLNVSQYYGCSTSAYGVTTLYIVCIRNVGLWCRFFRSILCFMYVLILRARLGWQERTYPTTTSIPCCGTPTSGEKITSMMFLKSNEVWREFSDTCKRFVNRQKNALIFVEWGEGQGMLISMLFLGMHN